MFLFGTVFPTNKILSSILLILLLLTPHEQV